MWGPLGGNELLNGEDLSRRENCTKSCTRCVEKIINKKNLLRRIGYHPAALSPDFATTVANAMTNSNYTNHSGIWQMGKEASEIQAELYTAHRTVLGVETSTRMSAVRHERRVKTQLLRANITRPKFRKSQFSRHPRVACYTAGGKREHAY